MMMKSCRFLPLAINPSMEIQVLTGESVNASSPAINGFYSPSNHEITMKSSRGLFRRPCGSIRKSPNPLRSKKEKPSDDDKKEPEYEDCSRVVPASLCQSVDFEGEISSPIVDVMVPDFVPETLKILDLRFRNLDCISRRALSTVNENSLEDPSQSYAVHKPEILTSDDSEDDIDLGAQCHLMDKVGLTEVALTELTHELQLSVSEEVRSEISSLDTELVNENERFASLTTKIDKYRELRKERERKFDLQYRRTIAEALDNHLTAVQRDHEHISQIEERRIRDDMAREEAKRKEKAIQEEKLLQERIKVEEEASLKAEMTERTERAKAAAVEAEKQAAEEATAKRASETSKTANNAVDDSKATIGSSSSTDVKKGVQSSGNLIKASENALELEKRRRQLYEDLSAKNKDLKSANQDCSRHGSIIGRQIRTISASIENVKIRAQELLKLFNNPGCPQSIQLFAEKVVSNCTNQKSSNAVFATCSVIVLVTSKFPVAMDVLIAELNRVCIYTVPKHISFSQEVFDTKGAYFKALGYNEGDGKLETVDAYIERLSCYMKLYGALVQTDIEGFKNLHGLTQGWAWLARFLNHLPANLYTAVALDSFLEMAGYGLYRAYKSQFEKLVGIIGHDFLNALKDVGGAQSSKLIKAKTSLHNYIESKQYKKEPEGLHLRSHLESNDFY